MEELFGILSTVAKLSPAELNALGALAVPLHLAKGELFIREGHRASQLAFIERGYLRKFFVRDGKELTDFFYLDRSFTGDIPAMPLTMVEPSTTLPLASTIIPGPPQCFVGSPIRTSCAPFRNTWPLAPVICHMFTLQHAA